jgi:hypothetical protein
MVGQITTSGRKPTKGDTMITTHENRIKMQENEAHAFHADELAAHHFGYWPVCWSAVQVGVLSTLAAIVFFGLVGIALGFHLVGVENRVVDLTRVGFAALAFSVFSAFLASVAGGWVSGKVAGIRRSETAMCHAAITWLATIPILILLASLGAGSYFGGWYSGLAGSPSWASHTAAPFDRPEPIGATATEAERTQYAAARADYDAKVKQWRDETPRATRNAALGAVTALLLGLMGSVIGGWMASGEPMTLTYYRTRDSVSH